MLACLVINQKQDKERRRSIVAELGRLKLDYEFIDTVDGALLRDANYYEALREEFVDYLPENWQDIPINPGQLGCLLSHVRAFRYARLKNYRRVLIVEDDAQFCIDDGEILNQLAQTDVSWDCLKLGLTGKQYVRGIYYGSRKILGKTYRFNFILSGIAGTVCNLYTSEGIEKLLTHLPRFRLSDPIDVLILRQRHLLDLAYVGVQPQIARENPNHHSTIMVGRENSSAVANYEKGERFLSRKKRQLRNTWRSLKDPTGIFLKLANGIDLFFYCLKYLLFKRKKPSRLAGVNAFDSAGPGKIYFFRQLRINIPRADAYLVLYDLAFGALYWLTHPKQYPVFRWWCEIARRTSEARSPDGKPKDLFGRRLLHLLQQSLYYGQIWRRFHLQKTPKTLLTWNGWRTKWARQAIVPAGVKNCFLEHSPLPSFMTVDAKGVNAEISIPREGNFYRAWGLMHPELKSSWQDIGSRIIARPKSAGAVTTSHGLIQELPKKFIFIPLQKKDDSQIFLHSGWVYSVDNFIKYVYEASAHLPDGWSILMKTHPSDTGIRPETVFKDAPNNVFNGELFDSVQLLKSCSALVNINGSMGLQAYFFAKPVVTCGNNFYDFAGMARRCQSVEDLCQVFAGIDSLSYDEPLRKHFLNWLINCYYLEIPPELERHILFRRSNKYDIELKTRQSFADRITGDWDVWSGLGSDPTHWADLIQKHEVASAGVGQPPPASSDRKIKALI